MIFFDSNQNNNTQILCEQYKRLRSGFFISAIANLLVSSLLVYVLWDVVVSKVLITWFGLLFFVILVRAIFYVNHKDISDNNVKLYLGTFVLGCGATGLVWGVGVAVIFPALTLNYQVFMVAALMGMGAGSMSTLAVYLPAFLSFFPISFLPVTSLFFLSFNEPVYTSFGFCSILIVISMSYFGVQNNRILIQSLKLRFENNDLIEELKSQTNRADRANLEKSKFLAMASHDLRQPLYALTLFSSELDELVDDLKTKKLISQIQRVAKSLQNQFDALLDISQLDAGGVKVEIVELNLSHFFDNLDTIFSAQAQEKNIAISWPDSSHSLSTDEVLLTQILSNFISNAIRYTQSGEIHIDCQYFETYMLINVQDSGVGISPQDQSLIFSELYQKKHARKHNNQGLGLGLFIAKRTAELLGYSLSVQSKLSVGSVFSVKIPIEKNDQNTD